MLTDSEKLAQIATILSTESTPAPAAAYDRPQLPVEQIQFKDGKTHNPDGSLWSIDPFSQQPVCVAFGYISPVKTPEVWTLGNTVLGANFADWEARWKKNPFAVYRADIPALVRRGTEVNFVLFDMLTQSSDTFVQ